MATFDEMYEERERLEKLIGNYHIGVCPMSTIHNDFIQYNVWFNSNGVISTKEAKELAYKILEAVEIVENSPLQNATLDKKMQL